MRAFHSTLPILPRLSALLAVGCIVGASASSAQQVQELELGTVTVSRQPAPIRTLDKALEQVGWDAERRGPLLMVNPQNTHPWQPKPSPDETLRVQLSPVLPPPPRGGYLLRPVADFFGRKIVRCGTLTVLAPAEMVVFNTHPAPPDIFAGLRRDQKMQMLEASFSPAQWRLLGSPSGIGLGDLAAEQKALFLSLLPDPFRVRRVTVSPGGGSRINADENSTTLSPAQRSGIRLRLNRVARMMLPSESTGNPLSDSYVVGISGQPSGAEYWTLETRNEWEPRSDAFGVTLRQEVPNRLKPGQLDFDAAALNPTVSLASGTGIAAPSPFARPVAPTAPTAPATPPSLTVAGLVKRVAEATRVELYADPRVGNLPVWTRGDRARSGDVLKALCYAVTGTFRKVGPAFVLTDDIAGIGTRRVLLSEWSQDAQALQSREQQALTRRIREQQPLQYVAFSPDDPLAPSADVLRAIEQAWTTIRGRYEGHEMPVSRLTSAQQTLIRETLDRWNQRPVEQRPRNISIRGDRVRISVDTRLTYVVPGLGAVEDGNVSGGGLDAFLPAFEPYVGSDGKPISTDPARLPPSMRDRVLLIAPTTVDEAERAVLAVRRHGMTHLWIEVPEGDGRKLLIGAIEAGKANQVPVSAVVQLMQASKKLKKTTGPDAPLDINILGETGAEWAARRRRSPMTQQFPWMQARFENMGDWLRPDEPATLLSRKRWLTDLAATPGLASLVLRDAAVPGYGEPGNANSDFYDPNRSDFGYTLERRLRFLRQEEIDPVDLSVAYGYGSMDMNLPFFQEASARWMEVDGQYVQDQKVAPPGQKWNQLRYETNARLLAELFAALRVAQPNLPLAIRDLASTDFYRLGGWYGSWDKPDALPVRSTGSVNVPRTEVQAARASSKRVLRNFTFVVAEPGPDSAPDPVKPDSPQALARMLNAQLSYEKGAWNGLVLDLSGLPIEKALPLLTGLAPPAAPSAAP